MRLNWISTKDRDLCLRVKRDRIELYQNNNLREPILTRYLEEEENSYNFRTFAMDNYLVLIYPKSSQFKISFISTKRLLPVYSIIVDKPPQHFQQLNERGQILAVTSNELIIVKLEKSKHHIFLRFQQDIQDARGVINQDSWTIFIHFRTDVLKTYSKDLRGAIVDKFVKTQQIANVDQIELLNNRLVYVKNSKIFLYNRTIRASTNSKVKIKPINIKGRDKQGLLISFDPKQLIVVDSSNQTWRYKTKCQNSESLFRQHFFAEYSLLQKLQLCFYSYDKTKQHSQFKQVRLYPVVEKSIISYKLISKFSSSLFVNAKINPELQFQLQGNLKLETIRRQRGGLSQFLFAKILKQYPDVLFHTLADTNLSNQQGYYQFAQYIENSLQKGGKSKLLFELINRLIVKCMAGNLKQKQKVLKQLQSVRFKIKIRYYASQLLPQSDSKETKQMKFQTINKIISKPRNQKYNQGPGFFSFRQKIQTRISDVSEFVDFLTNHKDELTLDYFIFQLSPNLILQTTDNIQLIHNITRIQNENREIRPARIVHKFLMRSSQHKPEVYQYYFNYCLINEYYCEALMLLPFSTIQLTAAAMSKIFKMDKKHGNRLFMVLEHNILGLSTENMQQLFLLYFKELKNRDNTELISQKINRVSRTNKDTFAAVICPVLKNLGFDGSWTVGS